MATSTLIVIWLLTYATAFHVDINSRVNLHKSSRAKILSDEAHLALGGNLTLTSDEEKVNDCLMRRKFAEHDYGFYNPQYFNFSHPYFSYKDKIKYSRVYQIIKQMPKGAALHVHDTSLLGPDYLLKITYADNLYVCFSSKGVSMLFSNKTPDKTCSGTWKLMKEARNKAGDVNQFDMYLRQQFTLVTEDPENVYPDVNAVWRAFRSYFEIVDPLLTYQPIWENYFYDALKTFREDKISYVELRSTLPSLYDLNGTTFDELTTAKTYKKVIDRFKHEHQDFIGAKIIYAPFRGVNKKTVAHYIDVAKELKRDFPEIFAGFDLVGQEDLGAPLIEFLPELVEASQYLDYYFHAGETNWYGTSTDENLVDAILLGAKRIGHAYALTKHPLLMREVFERNIGLEINVISNEVLSLVKDVRNHPLAVYLAHDMPVVLSSDDPGAWEAEPLSYDYYVAFQGVANRLADIKLLKTLTLNSLVYSSLEDSTKNAAMIYFNNQWNEFIKNFTCD